MLPRCPLRAVRSGSTGTWRKRLTTRRLLATHTHRDPDAVTQSRQPTPAAPHTVQHTPAPHFDQTQPSEHASPAAPGAGHTAVAVPLPQQQGGPNDHFANERTYLAWVRSALAFVALGIGLHEYGARLSALEEERWRSHEAAAPRQPSTVSALQGGLLSDERASVFLIGASPTSFVGFC